MKLIKKIDLQNKELVKELYEVQRRAYLVEANLIGYLEIPPLTESINDLENCGETFLGYFDENVLIGALSYTIEGEELTICRMVVHPDHFRKGVAHKLLNALESFAPQLVLLKVSTGKKNVPAKNLYIKNGFEIVSDQEIVPGLFISHFEKRL